MSETLNGLTKPLDILIFTPCAADEYGVVKRLEPETVASLFQLQWPGALSYLFQVDNPYPDGRANVLHQYQRARSTFLAGRWDALFVVESDIILTAPDVLLKLAALNADLAYGMYMFRSQPYMLNLFERYPGKARNHGESLTVWPSKYAAALEKKQIDVSGGGLGCVLIRRNVLELVDFRHEGEKTHCDSFFTMDVYSAGFSMRADTSVACGHKKPDGEVIYPPQVHKRGESLV